jgi:hypothetical protein
VRTRSLILLAALATLLFAIPVYGASASSVGGCPSGASEKWVLASVEGLGIDPALASGIPSLDGNGDGNTCIRKLHPSEGTICNQENPIIFRDNTVPGPVGEPLDCGFGHPSG